MIGHIAGCGNGLFRRIVLPNQSWESFLRSAVGQANRFAVGSLQLRTEAGTQELLCRQLELRSSLPRGVERPPLEDWIVLLVSDEGGASARTWAERIEPRRSHRLAVVVLDAADRARWDAVLYDREQWYPLDAMLVPGPGMLRIDREPDQVDSDNVDDPRWSRSVGALGRDTFRKVRQSAVTLVGAGRNGSLAAFQLAALGIRSLRILDPDILELSNLSAMPGLRTDDVGRPKATALAERLLEFRPDISLSYLQAPAEDSRGQAFLRHRADLLLTCVDNDTPRLATSLVARELLMVHLDIGTLVRIEAGSPEITGDVRLLLPDPQGGCVACVGSIENLDDVLYELAAPAGVLRRGRPVAWHEQRAGSSLQMNALCVSTAVQTWLDLLAGRVRHSTWHRLRWRNGEGLEVDSANVTNRQVCVFCGAIPLD